MTIKLDGDLGLDAGDVYRYVSGDVKRLTGLGGAAMVGTSDGRNVQDTVDELNGYADRAEAAALSAQNSKDYVSGTLLEGGILTVFNGLQDISQLDLNNLAEGRVLLLPSGGLFIKSAGELVPFSLPTSRLDIPDIQVVDKKMFHEDYWYINGPRSASFCLTTSDNKIEIDLIARKANDLVALIWDKDDYFQHVALKRESISDFTGGTLEFDLSVSGSIPPIDSETAGAVLTVIDGNDNSYYIRLWEYSDKASASSCHVTLNFDNVKGGFEQDINIPWNNVSRVMLSVLSTSFDAENFNNLVTPESGKIVIENISSAKGGSPWVMGVNSVSLAPHRIGMCTAYDDSYYVSPKRIIDSLYSLGYRGTINHYCGMSHYYDKKWSSVEYRFKVVADNTEAPTYNLINLAAKKWHTSLAEQARDKEMNLLFSISYELFSEACPFEWTQRDWNDQYAATGYTPPSYMLSPCIDEAMDWLQSIFVEFATILDNCDLPVIMQIGEPWWWWNGSTRAPCIYDYPTRVKFNSETGLFAPEIPTIDAVHLKGTPYDEFKAFLKKELGNSTLAIRDAIKTAFPNSRVAPLIFLPSIADESVGIMREINFPKREWEYPAFDFIQTEVYDWLVRQSYKKSISAFYTPLDLLGYEASRVQYLGGFVPDNTLGQLIDPNYELEVDGKRIWADILGSFNVADKYGIGKYYVWAFPQIIRDSIIFQESQNMDTLWFGENVELVKGETDFSTDAESGTDDRIDWNPVTPPEVFDPPPNWGGGS